MNLTNLKWTKNVNHQGDDKSWAYQDIEPDLKIFPLHWKNDCKDNAHKPREGELILLRQRTKVTHIRPLAKVSDRVAEKWTSRSKSDL